MDAKKMLLIFNPVAGLEDFRESLFSVVDRFTKHGFFVTLYPTQGKRDAYHVALECCANYDYLVCSGGDGTLHEVVNALMQLSEKPVFGYIPSGTTNDFANSLGLPLDVLLATDAICKGQLQHIDIGRFGEDYFSYVAAFGLFTDVSYGTSQNIKNMLGHAAYILEGAKRLTNIKSYHCRITCDGEAYEDDFIFGMLLNSKSVGGFELPLSRENWQGDGAFEMVLLKKITRFSELQNVIAALMGVGPFDEPLIVRTVKDLTVSCDDPLDWTRDGEFGGSHKTAEIHVCGQAIGIMVPPGEV